MIPSTEPRISRSAAVLAAFSLLQRAIGLARFLLLVWLLPAAGGQYSLLMLGMYLALALAPLATAGLPWAMDRFVPRYEHRGGLAGLLGVTFACVLISTAVVASVLGAAAGALGPLLFAAGGALVRSDAPASAASPADLRSLTAVLAADLFATALFYWAHGVLRGLRRAAAAGTMETVQNLLFTAGAVAGLLWIERSARCVLAVHAASQLAALAVLAAAMRTGGLARMSLRGKWGQSPFRLTASTTGRGVPRNGDCPHFPSIAAGHEQGTASGVHEGHRGQSQAAGSSPPPGAIASTLRYSVPVGLAEFAWPLLAFAPLWVLSAAHGRAAGDVFAAQGRLAALLTLAGLAVAGAVGPHLSRMWEAGRREAALAAWAWWSKLVLCSLTLAAAAALAAAPWLLKLLPAPYRDAVLLRDVLVFAVLAGGYGMLLWRLRLAERTLWLWLTPLLAVAAIAALAAWFVPAAATRGAAVVTSGTRGAAVARWAGLAIAMLPVACMLAPDLARRRPWSLAVLAAPALLYAPWPVAVPAAAAAVAVLVWTDWLSPRA